MITETSRNIDFGNSYDEAFKRVDDFAGDPKLLAFSVREKLRKIKVDEGQEMLVTLWGNIGNELDLEYPLFFTAAAALAYEALPEEVRRRKIDDSDEERLGPVFDMFGWDQDKPSGFWVNTDDFMEVLRRDSPILAEVMNGMVDRFDPDIQDSVRLGFALGIAPFYCVE